MEFSQPDSADHTAIAAINHQGAALDMTRLNRILSFDPETGILYAEAGMTLADVIAFALPLGYFLPGDPRNAVCYFGRRCRE